MKKSEIHVGQTYENICGDVRRVTSVGDARICGFYVGQRDPVAVVYEVLAGPRKGKTGACTLTAFAKWAYTSA